jgi:YggT family protein
LGDLLCTVFDLYFLVLLGRILLSWFPVTPGTFLAQVNSVLYALTEPILGPLRRAIPPVRMGAAALDLSPIIAFIALRLLQSQIC